MDSNSFLISVIIPVYNCEKYLAAAIDSVLAQNYHSLEILIIDDGSTDKSAQIAQQYLPLIRYHYQPNQGTAAARNYGMKLATGDLFAFLDADDLWLPNKLDLQISVLANNPQIEAVFTHVCESKNPDEIDITTAIPGYLPSTMLIDRVAMNRIGEFSIDWKVAEWGECYLRAQSANLTTLMLPDLLAIRRIHPENKSTIYKALGMSEYIRILKANLDRSRSTLEDRDRKSSAMEAIN